MAKKSLRLSVGSIFTKGPGKIYFYRYQLDGHRKTVSLQTTNRAEAVKKAEALLPIIKATSTEVIAAHVQQARGLSSPIRKLSLDGVWDYYSTHPERATPATVNEQIQYRTTLGIHPLHRQSSDGSPQDQQPAHRKIRSISEKYRHRRLYSQPQNQTAPQNLLHPGRISGRGKPVPNDSFSPGA